MVVKGTSALLAVAALLLSACGAPESEADLRTELLEMARTDQEVRDRLAPFMLSRDPEALRTDEARRAIAEMEAADARNQSRLYEIVAEYGWPDARSVGNDAASAALLIVEHSDVEAKQRYLPILRRAVEEGKAAPSLLAQLEDEVSVATTGYQIYGTEITVVNGVPVLVPIADPDGLEARRAEVGLPPMEEYLKDADRDAIATFGVAVDRSALRPEQ